MAPLTPSCYQVQFVGSLEDIRIICNCLPGEGEAMEANAMGQWQECNFSILNLWPLSPGEGCSWYLPGNFAKKI